MTVISDKLLKSISNTCNFLKDFSTSVEIFPKLIKEYCKSVLTTSAISKMTIDLVGKSIVTGTFNGLIGVFLTYGEDHIIKYGRKYLAI